MATRSLRSARAALPEVVGPHGDLPYLFGLLDLFFDFPGFDFPGRFGLFDFPDFLAPLTARDFLVARGFFPGLGFFAPLDALLEALFGFPDFRGLAAGFLVPRARAPRTSSAAALMSFISRAGFPSRGRRTARPVCADL